MLKLGLSDRDRELRHRMPSRRGVACLAVFTTSALALGSMIPGSASAESKTYVVGMFHIATHSDQHYGPGDNCPHGSNGVFLDVERRILQREFGYTLAQANQKLASREREGDGEKKGERSINEMIRERGKIDGKWVSIYNYPMSVPKTADYVVEGHHAYGFDLDGKGPDQRGSFEDPQTHEKGVDNNLFKAVGCYAQFDINLPVRPSYEESVYMAGLPVIPAWIFTVTGNDLSKDGDVTVTFNKAVEHPRMGADGTLLRNATYTIDPNPRNFGHLKGQIRSGVLTATGDQLVLEGETPMLTELNLSKAHIRFKIAPDGSLGGYAGGYQPYMDYWFMAAFSESNLGLDLATLYWNLSEFAEANPDPKTGKNTAISATYRMEAVPAFAAPAPPYVPPAQLRAGKTNK